MVAGPTTFDSYIYYTYFGPEPMEICSHKYYSFYLIGWSIQRLHGRTKLIWPTFSLIIPIGNIFQKLIILLQQFYRLWRLPVKWSV